jgi:hypothetical protein
MADRHELLNLAAQILANRRGYRHLVSTRHGSPWRPAKNALRNVKQLPIGER